MSFWRLADAIIGLGFTDITAVSLAYVAIKVFINGDVCSEDEIQYGPSDAPLI